jgi:hypothetical protein
LRKITGQIHIELDDVDWEVGQQVEAGVARTEVIQSDLEATLPVIFNYAANMCAVDRLLLCDLEDDLITRKPNPRAMAGVS